MIEREHQRRMASLRAEGTIADPCVQAGMMTVEVLACIGFPGDSRPG